MNQVYDTLILGGGPAGYTAALYAARAGLSVLVIEQMSAGGQMTLTEMIDNYPGFAEILFCPTPTDQIAQFGAKIETRFGLAATRWWHEGEQIRYEVVTPVSAKAIIAGKEYQLTPGTYRF